MTKSAISCGFLYIYWRNPTWKNSFLCSGCKKWELKEEHSGPRQISTDAENLSVLLPKALSSVFDWILNTLLAPSLQHFFWLHILPKIIIVLFQHAAVWALSVKITEIRVKSLMPCFFMMSYFFCFSRVFSIFNYLFFCLKCKKVSTTIDLRDL